MSKKKLLRFYSSKIVSLVVASTILVSASVGIVTAVPAEPPAGSSLEQRVQFRKNEFKPVLEKQDEQRLKGRCIAIQAMYRNFQQQLAPKISNYQKRYQSIDAKLYLAIGKLKLAERDTLELEKQRSTLASKVAALDATFTNYRQSLDDVVVVNCQADLVGFKALLETSRGYHEAVRAQTSDIRTFVVDTIKATLAGHISALQPKAQGR